MQTYLDVIQDKQWAGLHTDPFIPSDGHLVFTLNPNGWVRLEDLNMRNMFLFADPQAPPSARVVPHLTEPHVRMPDILQIPTSLRAMKFILDDLVVQPSRAVTYDLGILLALVWGASSHLLSAHFSLSSRIDATLRPQVHFQPEIMLKLRHLHLLDNVPAAKIFLDQITAPVLETLRMDFYCGTRSTRVPMLPEDLKHIVGFLKRSNAPVSDLQICIDDLDVNGLRQIIALTPQLRTLCIVVRRDAGNHWYGENADASSKNIYEEGLCPELKEIRVSHYNFAAHYRSFFRQ